MMKRRWSRSNEISLHCLLVQSAPSHDHLDSISKQAGRQAVQEEEEEEEEELCQEHRRSITALFTVS